jgi:hypothetical protein
MLSGYVSAVWYNYWRIARIIHHSAKSSQMHPCSADYFCSIPSPEVRFAGLDIDLEHALDALPHSLLEQGKVLLD